MLWHREIHDKLQQACAKFSFDCSWHIIFEKASYFEELIYYENNEIGA
jgi:hypothetical protein